LTTKGFLSFLSPEPNHEEFFLSLPTARYRYGTLDTYTRWLQDERESNLFFLVANSGNGKRKDGDITSVRAFYVDFDKGERYVDGRVVRSDGSTLAVHLEPSLVVNSKNGDHLYWVLSTPSSDLAAFTATQKSLIAYYSSDISIHDLSRVMRLPGSVHNKVAGEPFMVTWELASGIRYTVAQVTGGLSQPVESSKVADCRDLRTVEDCLSAISAAGRGNRNDTLNACAFRIAHIEQDNGRNPESVRDAITWAVRRMSAPLSGDEVITTIDSAFAEAKNRPNDLSKPHTAERLLRLPDAHTYGTSLAELWEGSIKLHEQTERWHQYTPSKGIWREITARDVDMAVTTSIDLSVYKPPTLAWVRETVHFASLTARMAAEGLETDDNLLPFTNGVLDKTTGILSPHAAGNNFVWTLPVPFDPEATAPIFTQWLDDVTGGDTGVQRLLLAVLGATIHRRSDLQKFFELYGTGGTGKSTFLRVAQDLVGKDNYTSTSLERLENNKFDLARCAGKALVVCPDQPAYHGTLSSLQRMTGGDDVPFEKKGKDATGFTFKGVILIASNKPMAPTTSMSALARRRETIPFFHVVKKVDPRFSEKLRSELAGITNLILKLSQDDITDIILSTDSIPTIKETRRSVLLETSPLAAWVDECCVFAPDHSTAVGMVGNKGSLYGDYTDFCESTGTKPKSLNTFSADLLDFGLSVGVALVKKKTMYGRHITGIKLKAM